MSRRDHVRLDEQVVGRAGGRIRSQRVVGQVAGSLFAIQRAHGDDVGIVAGHSHSHGIRPAVSCRCHDDDTCLPGSFNCPIQRIGPVGAGRLGIQ